MSETPKKTKTDSATDLSETVATENFIKKFINRYGEHHPTFQTCSLSEAIDTACFSSIVQQKILLLYFHNEAEEFSDMFCKCLAAGKIKEIIETNFFLLPWDVASTGYKSVLINSVTTNLDTAMEKFVQEKRSALFLICSIEKLPVIFMVISGLMTETDLLTTLEKSVKFFEDNCKVNFELEVLRKETASNNDFDSRTFQQVMFNQLADRDYDFFEENEHEYLKKKIGFSLFGTPQDAKGYNYKQNKRIENIYEKILTCSDEISQWKNTVLISFIYNCTEPLPNEKLKRSQIYKDYNPNTDIKPFPIYVLKKCEGGKSSCRLFIDTDLRVYQNWTDYISNNELHKCQMILPKNGHYRGDIEGNVILEKYLSPACEVGATILQKLDIVSSAVGAASAGIIIAALIPAIAVAPVALTVAATSGIGAGLYAAVRSSIKLFDRKKHKQTLNFNSPEARGAYIDIIAGSLGFVGAGAHIVVSHLISNGIAIGQGARATMDLVNVANISASGLSITNSGYEIYEKWLKDNETATSLTIAQLTYSVLFFGNVICKTDETNTLKTLQDSQQCNRFRRTFDELIAVTNINATAHFSESISTIYNFSDTDRITAVLLRSNKIFQHKNILFASQNEQITLNSIIIDVKHFSSIFRDQMIMFSIDVPTALPTHDEIQNVSLHIKNIFGVENFDKLIAFNQNLVTDNCMFAAAASSAIGMLNDCLQIKIIKIMKMITDKFVEDVFDFVTIFKTIFPKSQCLIVLLRLIVGFFKRKVIYYEQNYQVEKQKAEESKMNFDETEFNAEQMVDPKSYKRAQQFFEKALDDYVNEAYSIDFCLEEIYNYCMQWLSLQVYVYVDTKEKIANRKVNNIQKIHCCVCSGYSYSN